MPITRDTDKRRAQKRIVENSLAAGELGRALSISSNPVRQHGCSVLENAVPRVAVNGALIRPMSVQTNIRFPYDTHDLRQFSVDLGGDRQFIIAIGFSRVDKSLEAFAYNTPRGQPAARTHITNAKHTLEKFSHSTDAGAINLVRAGNILQIRHPDIPVYELVFDNGAFTLRRQRIIRMRYFTDSAADAEQKYPGLFWNVPMDSGNVDYRRVVDEEELRVTRAIADTAKVNFFDNDLNGLQRVSDYDAEQEYTYSGITASRVEYGNAANPQLLPITEVPTGSGTAFAH